MSFSRALNITSNNISNYRETLLALQKLLKQKITINTNITHINQEKLDQYLKLKLSQINNISTLVQNQFENRKVTQEIQLTSKELLLNLNSITIIDYMLELIETELSLFSKEDSIVDLYEYLMRVQKIVDSSSKSILYFQTQFKIIEVALTDLDLMISFGKYSIDFTPLKDKITFLIKPEYFILRTSLSINQKIKMFVEIKPILDNALEVLKNQYQIYDI